MTETEKKDLKRQIVEEIKRVAKEQNLETISLSIFREHSDISIEKIYKVYNSWSEPVEAAGLKPDTTRKKKGEDELWEEFFRVCIEIDNIPNTVQFRRTSKSSMHTYTRRYGSRWNDILLGFKEWLKEKHPDSKFIDLLPDKSKPQSKITQPINKEHHDFVWQSKKEVVYGPPIDFRDLRHAPINEQGVVFLFGKISEELGFSIEAIRTDYPDCDGKRLVDRNKNLWEKVSIEFEYRSSNFHQHAHDASKCDVIVCWIHDWSDCPLEVIELREVIKQLKK